MRCCGLRRLSEYYFPEKPLGVAPLAFVLVVVSVIPAGIAVVSERLARNEFVARINRRMTISAFPRRIALRHGPPPSSPVIIKPMLGASIRSGGQGR